MERLRSIHVTDVVPYEKTDKYLVGKVELGPLILKTPVDLFTSCRYQVPLKAKYAKPLGLVLYC